MLEAIVELLTSQKHSIDYCQKACENDDDDDADDDDDNDDDDGDDGDDDDIDDDCLSSIWIINYS